MARKKQRRIGPIGTTSRALVGFGLVYLALSDGGLSWGLHWYDVAVGLVAFPAVMLAIGLAASRLGSGPVRFTGPLSLAVNAALGVALFANQYTAGGGALYLGTALIVAAWLAHPGCELSVLSNAILRRDDQIGCFVFTPIDELERRLSARTHQRRARTETGTA